MAYRRASRWSQSATPSVPPGLSTRMSSFAKTALSGMWGPGLDRPDDVEARVRERERHRVVDLKPQRQIGGRQFPGTPDLIGADRHAGDREAVVPRQDPAASAYAAPYVQRRSSARESIQAAPADHLVHEIRPSPRGSPCGAAACRVTQMDVLAPIELQDTVFRPSIVGIDDGAQGGDSFGRRRDRTRPIARSVARMAARVVAQTGEESTPMVAKVWEIPPEWRLSTTIEPWLVSFVTARHRESAHARSGPRD